MAGAARQPSAKARTVACRPRARLNVKVRVITRYAGGTAVAVVKVRGAGG